MKKRVVKRAKHTEEFQKEKLRSSIHASCLSVCDFAGAADQTAEMVCRHVEDWLEPKAEITSSDLRRVAGSALQKYSPAAAHVYVNIHNVN